MSEIDEGLRSELQKAGHLGHLDAGALQLGPAQFDLAAAVRAGLLRDRDDRDRRVALRSRALRRRSFPALAAPGGPDDRGRHGDQENGAAGRAALQPDARAEIRHLDGRVRDFRRAVQAGLQRAQGHRPLHSGGRSHPRLPAAARGAAPCFHEVAAQDRRTETDRRRTRPRHLDRARRASFRCRVRRARSGAAEQSGRLLRPAARSSADAERWNLSKQIKARIEAAVPGATIDDHSQSDGPAQSAVASGR